MREAAPVAWLISVEMLWQNVIGFNGAGLNVIAFNATDGRDVILPGREANNTLSLGTDVNSGKLYFRRMGADLRLEVNDDNSVTFRDWYSGADNRNFSTLQIFNGGQSGPKSVTQPLADRYDFKALVARFDTARAVDPTADRWSVMNGLLEVHLASGDAAALGGDLAAVYANQGDLAGVNLSTAQDLLRSAQFGTEAQMLRPWQQISSDAVRLS